MAAANGDHRAREQLIVLYWDIGRSSDDSVEAARWFRLGADLGDSSARQNFRNTCCNLGKMFYEGKIVPQDLSESYRWYLLAAESQGVEEFLKEMVRTMTPEMVSSGERRAKDWLASISAMGVPAAPSAEAVRWWIMTAGEGNAQAQYNLGEMYFAGNGVPMNKGETARWWSKAAEQGYADAAYWLGMMYSVGDGVPHDDTEAERLWSRAAEKGHAGAREALNR